MSHYQRAGQIVINLIRRHFGQFQRPSASDVLSLPALATNLANAVGVIDDNAEIVVQAGLGRIAEAYNNVHMSDMNGAGALAELQISIVSSGFNALIAQNGMLSANADDKALLNCAAYDAHDINTLADLINEDLASEQAAAVPQAAATASAQPPAERKNYEKLDATKLNERILKAIGLPFQQGTNNQINNAMEAVDRILSLQGETEMLRSALAVAQANGGTDKPSGQPVPQQVHLFTSELKTIADIIPLDRIAGTGGGNANTATPGTAVSATQVSKLPIRVWHCEPGHPKVPKIDPNYMFDAHNLAAIAYATERGSNFMMVGPTGSGKTTFLEQFAARTGRPFFRLPVDGSMRRRELIGGHKQIVTEKGSMTAWTDGLLTQAIQIPGLVDLDEFDRADPDLAYAAHQALERKGLLLLEDESRFIPMNPSCVIAGTANTKGRADENGLYSLQSEMSEATRDRFVFWLDHDYLSQADEQKLIRAKFPEIAERHAETITKIGQKARVQFKEGDIRTALSHRQTLETAAYMSFMSRTMDADTALKLALNAIIVNRAPDKNDQGALAETVSLFLGN